MRYLHEGQEIFKVKGQWVNSKGDFVLDQVTWEQLMDKHLIKIK